MVPAGVVPPRRRVDLETTPGRCGNLDYCSIGMQRVQVQVPVSQPFVCPECGSPLRPPGRKAGKRNPIVLPALRIAVLLAAMAVSAAGGYAVGRVQHSVGQAVQTAAQRADASLAQARLAFGLATPPATAPSATPPVQTIHISERSYPPHAVPVDISNPAPRLGREARFGQVTIDCGLDQAFAHPACQITEIRGADGLAAPLAAFLQGLTVAYPPPPRSFAPPADHRWRLVLEDFSGTARRTTP